ncbi:MAG: ACP S-malonyltransferase, partial [Clostridiaceae bacterium]|nr:ACP S-malonyltransferase [Clostridiaceae bacterium]
MLTTTILFPGQGSQYVGMGKALYERSSEARKVFEEAEDVLKINLRKLCFEGDLEELTKTENAQPAILTCSVAAFNEYMHMYGMEPSYCAGHSLGEYSALTCAGVLKFSDAVSLVRQRGKYMQEAAAAGSGAMAAVSGIKSDELEEMCREYSGNGETVVISNYNSPDQIVISGHKNTVEILKD